MSAISRRQFVGGTAAVLGIRPPSPAAREPGGPVAAHDESFWSGVQAEFQLDRSAVYLNAAGVAPAMQSTMDSMLADTAFRNRLPARHLWNVLEPRVESVRRQVASAFGCHAEEIALTRNATEALQIVQLGLDLRSGDEVLTTEHDFFRMMNTWQQRVERDGIVLKTVPVRVPAEPAADLVDRFDRAITPRTRALLFCHVTNVTGQIFPVRDICAMARDRGVRTVVDGAQAFGHLPFTAEALGCDYYGGSLHKYVLAPLGTGFLHVRRPLIADLWPLTPAAPSRRPDIRKFEDVGTHPAAAHNAVSAALGYRAGIGQPSITARLRYLTMRWVERLRDESGLRLFNRFTEDATCGIATVGIDGADPRELVDALWSRFGIVTRPVTTPECPGVRVSPHIYNSVDEVDHFAHAMMTLNGERRSKR